MRLLFVSHSAELYGAELGLHELVQRLLADDVGHVVHVVCPSDGPLVAMMADLGVETTVVPYHRWATRPASLKKRLRLGARNLRAVPALRRVIRATRPDVVVTSTVTLPSPAIAARVERVPHVLYAQEFGVPEHGVVFHWGRERSLRALGRLSHVVVVASHALRRDFARFIDPAKLRVVYHAANLTVPDRPPRPDGPLRVGMMGHKAPGKGQDQAVEAVARLRARGIDVSLVLVGPGSGKFVDRLVARVDELGIGDRVEFVGFVADPAAHFAGFDVSISCSEHEGLPRVVIEAMKCGCAVVGARSGGTEELIVDGWNGYLYGPGDVDDLAEKIALLAEDRAHASQLGAHAAAWARQRFTPGRYARDFLDAVAMDLRGERIAASTPS